MSSDRRPKRPSEPFLMDSHGYNGRQQPKNKKPRFDTRNPSALAVDEDNDDVDDTMLAADVIGARGQQVRRSAVNIDGYDSDSDNDNFDARAAAKARAKKETARQQQQKQQKQQQNPAVDDDDDDDDVDDIFADLAKEVKRDAVGGDDGGGNGSDSSDDDAETKAWKQRKAVRFLDLDEIKGQVKNSRSGRHVNADFHSYIKSGARDKDREKEEQGVSRKFEESDESDENDGGQRNNEEESSDTDSEVGDDVRASIGDELIDEELGAGSKKTHAPKLDAFNMRQEREEGRFDDQGNFVRTAVDPDAKHDVWMEGISRREIRAAKEAEARREQERRRRNLEDDAKATPDVLRTLIPLLHPGETILEALARLAKARPKAAAKSRRKKSAKNDQAGAAEAAAEAAAVDQAEVKRRQDVEAITAAADLLLGRGQPEIYEAERELLVRQYNREAEVPWQDEPSGQDADTAEDDKTMWEYKWTDARDGHGTINGPFDSKTMRAWNEAGYFGDGVVFRQVGHSGQTSWTRVLPV